MRKSALTPLIGFLCCTVVATTINAADIVVPAAKDNTLYEDASGSLSNGAGQNFFAGRVGLTGSGEIRRGLVAFDIAGAIPPGSVITAASLRLTMNKTSAGATPVSVHRVTADWGEGTSVAPGEEGQGAPATTNDATWTRRFYNTINWATPGGDFVATASATQSVTLNGNYTWSSAGLLADVQGWLSNPAGNFGWIVIGDETTQSSAKRFASKENLSTASRPALTITYEPATAVEDWHLY